MTFEELGLDSRLLQGLDKMEIVSPTAIQREAIPVAITGRDVIGVAPTGSGKTLAYLMPMLHWVLHAKLKHENPSVLILVPTRELVKQVDLVIKEAVSFTEIFTAQVFSGPRENKQKRVFQETVDIIVATPGRLNKFAEEGVVELSNISVLIIDEADRLLDMGFLPDINALLKKMPHKNSRQTMLFGSTLPGDVELLAKTMQKGQVLVDVGRSRPPDQIEHAVFEAHEDEKFDVLIEILKDPDIEKVLIFLQSKHEARITARNLEREGLELEEIHAGLTQRQRSMAIDNFQSGEVNALVASDLAARGLDIADITHVISYDVPSNFDDYVHRAGRTGRAFREGVSWIIASPREFASVANIDRRLGEKMPRLREIPRKKKSSPQGRRKR